MWGAKAGVPLHSIHFGFPIGTLLGPYIVSAFIPDDTTPNLVGFNDTQNITADVYVANVSNADTSSYDDVTDDSSIEYAFLIASACTVAMAVAFFIIEFVRFPVNTSGEQIQKKASTWKEILNPKLWAMGSVSLGVFSILLLNAFYICHVGALKGPVMLLTTYALDSDLGFSRSEAASLTAATGIGGAVSRALMIGVAGLISVDKILILAIHAQLLTAVLLMCFGSNSKTSLWVCSLLFGVAIRPIWATGYQWGNEYIIMVAFVFALTRTISRVADVGQNALQGYLYSNVTYESIFYTSVTFAVLHCLVLYLMLLLGRYYGTRHTRAPHEELKENGRKEEQIKKEDEMKDEEIEDEEMEDDDRLEEEEDERKEEDKKLREGEKERKSSRGRKGNEIM